jgi:hypothetical protein
MQHKHSTSPQLNKSKSQASAIKVMLPVFFDIEGTQLLGFKHNAKHYSQGLQKLHTMIKNKHSGKLTDSIIMLHDNVHPHRSQDSGPTEHHGMGGD